MSKPVLQFLSHSGVRITTPEGQKVLVDPWITGNPISPFTLDDIAGPGMADLVLVTHDHMDHITDVAEIVKRTGATLIAVHETAVKLQTEQGVAAEQVPFAGFGMNLGGSIKVGGVKITLVQAVHSSNSGVPAGFIIELEDGTAIYHAGDTALFPGMEMIGEAYDINVALLPIDGCFAMGPREADIAVDMLGPETVIPIHFKTFPFLTQSADEFLGLVKSRCDAVVLEPGESFTIAEA